jgi:rsbT co-antagonist protein RsbR
MSTTHLPEILKNSKSQILEEWLKQQSSSIGARADLIKDAELRKQSEEFLNNFQRSAQSGETENVKAPAWTPTLELLAGLTRQRERMGFSPSETALFVFSLKEPLLAQVRVDFKKEPELVIEESIGISALLDKLGLYTTEVYQASREDVIRRQQEELLELSTPVVKMWDGIVALPLIGTLDSARTSVVMESLLQRIVETGSEIAIIDITGVPTVDTLVAQHLLKTVAAARLMGADCIISGIRPQIAQTMVHLAIDLSAVTTKASMAEALKTALHRTGHRVVKDVVVKG